jgi:DNA polymerase-1
MFQRCYGGIHVTNQPSQDNIRRIDYLVVPCYVAMQSNGILVDKDYLRKFSGYLQEQKDRLTEKIRSQTGYYINAGSPDQIAALLFGKLGLKAPSHFKLTASGKRYTVDDEALSSIKHLHPVIPTIQDYVEHHKIKSSYADTLPVIASKIDGRVRTDLRLTRQVSGRVSSSNPNLMAQPVRSDLGKRIREAFIPRPGYVLVTIDQSQIEMRIAAHTSQCSEMCDTFLRGGDIHVETAARIFFKGLIAKLGRMPSGKEAEAAGMDKMRHRYPAKRIGFGVLFGITPEGLQDQIFVADDKTWTDADREKFRSEWPVDRCAVTIREWFQAYHEIRDYMSGEHANARRYGFNWCMFGRIRLIPEVRSVHKRIVEAGLRQSGNFKIQASATGTMKLFLAKLYLEYIVKKYKETVYPLLSIHDEGLFEVREDVADEFMYDAGYEMERVVRLDVPIQYSTAKGYSWGGLEK